MQTVEEILKSRGTTTMAERAQSVFGDANDWARYRAEIQFTGVLVGGTPADPELALKWIRKNLGESNKQEAERVLHETVTAVAGNDPTAAPETLINSEKEILEAVKAGTIDKKASVFKRIGDSPYLEGRQIKAMFKEATNIKFPARATKWGQYISKGGASKGTKVGGKDPKSFVAERVWVPERPYFMDNFDTVIMSDPVVGHPEDMFGNSKATISFFEYIEEPTLVFEFEVLEDSINPEDMRAIFQTAERNGLGARRSQGAGQFVTTAFERLGFPEERS